MECVFIIVLMNFGKIKIVGAIILNMYDEQPFKY